MQRTQVLLIAIGLFLTIPIAGKSSDDPETVRRDVQHFFRSYQLMVKYAHDDVTVQHILDTLQVPEYIKDVLKFMAFYSRAVLEGTHDTCVTVAKELLSKIENQYKDNIPEHHYKWMVGAVNQGYGSCLYYLSDYINSFFAYKEAYEMFDSIGDSTFAAIALSNMATVLVRVKMFDEVLKYYVLAKKYLIRDTFRLIPLNINIGVIYSFLNRPDLSLRHYNEALNLAEIVMSRYSNRLSEVEKRRILYRTNMAKINMASLFLSIVEKRSNNYYMELIKKMKMSIYGLLDSARALNRKVDTSSLNIILKGAVLDNEFKYWELKYNFDKSEEARDSLIRYLKILRDFYKKYGNYDIEGKKQALIAALEYRNLFKHDKRELYNECLEMIELEHEELQSLATSLVNIDLPTTSEGDFEKLLGELPYQCNLKYAVSVGLAILFGTILVLVAFLYSRGRREART